MRIVAEAAWTVDFGNWEGGATRFDPWLETHGGGDSGAKCGIDDGYEHPDYPAPALAVPDPSVSPSGTPIDPYALGTDHNATGCQATTGT